MTFPAGVIDIRKCSDEELKIMLDEARETSKHSRKLGRIMGIVAVRRLKKIREFLAYQELAIWRRMNGFDPVLEGEKNWLHGHRLLPHTSEQHTASLRLDLKKLQYAILMPAESTVIRPIGSLDKLLANFEFARIKEYVGKRSRAAA